MVPNYTEVEYTVVFSNPGPFTFDMPIGTVRARMEAVGGGGAGGSFTTNPAPQNPWTGGGGGGGAFSKEDYFPCLAGQQAAGVVGFGGQIADITGRVDGGLDGLDGMGSYIMLNGISVNAAPGKGGKANGAGGLGGQIGDCVGSIKHKGGNGGTGTPNTYAGGGGGSGRVIIDGANGNPGTLYDPNASIGGSWGGGQGACFNSSFMSYGGSSPGGGGGGSMGHSYVIPGPPTPRVVTDFGGVGAPGIVRLVYVVRTYN